jgi:hypothetical protein
MREDRFWPVSLKMTPADFRIGEQHVLFHGINKSGSGAFADVIHAAFFKAGRANQIFSTYHGCPRTVEAVLEIIRCSETSKRLVFIGHYLYGASPLNSKTPAYVTIFRHPLPRIISCHSWLANKHRAAGGTGTYPTLEAFVKNSQGKSQAQILQFGIGFGERRKQAMKAKTAKEIYETCMANVDNDLLWFGLAELFEESIFLLADQLALPYVPNWKRDTRNPARVSAFDVPRGLRNLIEKEYEYDFLFYENMLKRFKASLTTVEFGPEFFAYKLECAGEYKDRILA